MSGATVGQYLTAGPLRGAVTAVDTDAVRRRLLTDHSDVVRTVRDCAETAAATATEDDRTDTSAVRRGLEARLRARGVWERLPNVLANCVEAAGKALRAQPVAAAPYVAATATGVVLRATLAGGRLVVVLEVLTVERGERGAVLHPRDAPDGDLVRVEWR